MLDIALLGIGFFIGMGLHQFFREKENISNGSE